jgi:hypothetical protein
MDLEPSILTELSTMASDLIMTDLTTSALLIYNFNLDDIIGFFFDVPELSEPSELSEMSGTMTNLT